MASNYLHYCIKQKLEDVVEGIIEDHPPMHLNGQCVCQSDPEFVEEKQIRRENVVIGALESAFQECVSDFEFPFIVSHCDVPYIGISQICFSWPERSYPCIGFICATVRE